MYFGTAYDSVYKYIYVFGGCTRGDAYLNKCERYSVSTDTWLELSPMTKTANGKEGVSACFMQNYDSIYVFGGYNNQGFNNDIEKYSILRNSWETI